MRQDVKELADAMEQGWDLVPRMNRNRYYLISYNKVIAACAMGHAAIGHSKNTNSSGAVLWPNMLFPILHNQKIDMGTHETHLWDAITILNDEYDWTTPQIVAWLRTHIND